MATWCQSSDFFFSFFIHHILPSGTSNSFLIIVASKHLISHVSYWSTMKEWREKQYDVNLLLFLSTVSFLRPHRLIFSHYGINVFDFPCKLVEAIWNNGEIETNISKKVKVNCSRDLSGSFETNPWQLIVYLIEEAQQLYRTRTMWCKINDKECSCTMEKILKMVCSCTIEINRNQIQRGHICIDAFGSGKNTQVCKDRVYDLWERIWRMLPLYLFNP